MGASQAQAELEAKHGLKLALLNFASIKPLDTQAILDVARTGFIVTVEDHHADTGFGGQGGDRAGRHRRFMSAQAPRGHAMHYGHSGKPSELYRLERLDVEGIVKTVREASANGWLGK